jgi:thiamine pyrophosphate-dependent acetolactate synthase large subunit-like protein
MESALREMWKDDAPFLLDVHVQEEGMVMPMVPPGKGIHEIMITESEWYS